MTTDFPDSASVRPAPDERKRIVIEAVGRSRCCCWLAVVGEPR
jgi:hypothetical protein